MTRRAFALGVAVVMLAAGCKRHKAPSAPAVGEIPTQVLKSFEMNDVQAGVKSMTLISPEARIFDASQVADVDQPILVFYKNGKFSSRLVAPHGRVQMETHDVETWGGTTVISADKSTVTCDRLRYVAEKQKIYSDDAVRLEKTDSVTDGVGLETDPGLHTVKIGKQKVHFKKGMQ